MSSFLSAPKWRFSKTVTLSDTVENALGSVGIHNQSASSGEVKVTYAYQTGTDAAPVDVDDVITLPAGAYLEVQLRRVWTTGTTLAEADIRLLY